MTPEWSRRAARAFQWPPISTMDLPEKWAFRDRVVAAKVFDGLAQEDQAVILDAEAHLPDR